MASSSINFLPSLGSISQETWKTLGRRHRLREGRLRIRKRSVQVGIGEFSTLRECRCASKIPSGLSYDDAVALPSALSEAYLGLNSDKPHGAPLTLLAVGNDANTLLVVLGGSNSVGQYAIQLAKHSESSPTIAITSLKLADYLKYLGKTYSIDRKHLSWKNL